MDIQLEYMWSQRGQKLIVYRGNKYRRRRRMKNGDSCWECVKMSCSARICLDPAEKVLVGSYGNHGHEPDRGLARQIVNNYVRMAAIVNPNLKPGALLDKEISEKFPDLINFIGPEDIKNIKKAVMRARHKARMAGKLPSDPCGSGDSDSSSRQATCEGTSYDMEDDEYSLPLVLEDIPAGPHHVSDPLGDSPDSQLTTDIRRWTMHEESFTHFPEPLTEINASPYTTLPCMRDLSFVPQGSPSSTSPVPIAPKKSVPPPPPPQPQQVQPPPEVCLRWNSYHSNMQATFPSLLNNEQFVDVTLACEGRSIKCHKVMLSACSSYFEELLSQNPCQHPIIFMRDMKFWEVQALVEFMYSGEVNVAQEKLPSLLSAAEALQIKGLTPSTANSNNDDEHSGGGDADDSPLQPQKRVRKRKATHPVAYPVRLQNTPPSPVGNQLSQMPAMQPLQKIKVPMMSPLPGTSHHREEPTAYHPPVRIKRERSSTPPLALSMKEEPLDLGMDSSERNKDKDDSNGPQPASYNSSLQDAINRLHGKQLLTTTQGAVVMKMESNGGLSEDDGSGSERSPINQTDTGEGEV